MFEATPDTSIIDKFSSCSDQVVFESCIYPYEFFLEDFDKLRDPTADHYEVLSFLKKIILKERLVIDNERFNFLLSYIQAEIPNRLQNKAFDIILAYIKLGKKTFMKLVPEDFIDTIYSILPRVKAFEILIKCAKMDLKFAARITELGIVNFILNNLKKGGMLAIYTIDLFVNLMKYKELYEYTVIYVEKILEYSLIPQHHHPEFQIKAFNAICKIIKISDEFKQVVINSQYFMKLFEIKTNKKEKKIGVLKIACCLVDDDKILPIEFIKTPIWEYILDLLKSGIKDYYPYLFSYLFDLSRTEEGKEILISLKIIDLIINIIENAKYELKNEGMRVLCETACTENMSTLEYLISHGFFNLLGCSLSSLSLSVQKIGLDAICILIRIAEEQNKDELLSLIYNNNELISEIEILQDSDDDFIAGQARSIYLRMNFQ